LTLRVEPEPPAKGDAISLFGRDALICARRHDTDIGCVGELPIALLRRDPGGNLTDADGLYSELPLAIEGADWRDVDRAFLLGEDGTLQVVDFDSGHARLPIPVDGMPTVTSVSVGIQVCGISEKAKVVCQGKVVCNYAGTHKPAPAISSGRAEGVADATAVSVGVQMACALLADGRVQCWGHLESREACTQQEPRYIPGVNDAVEIATGEGEACARLADGRVKCWGSNGRLGLGVSKDEVGFAVEPVTVPGIERVVKLQGTASQKVALRDDGQVWIWGYLMTHDKDNAAPRRVEEIEAAIDIVVGSKFACALLPNHNLRCFGPRIEERPDKSERPPFEDRETWRNATVYEIWHDAPPVP
jgi:alpha-tubulin suppressor-like RCC1 family protein